MPAVVFCDGFDKYGPAGNQNFVSVATGDWSVSGAGAANIGLISPLSSIGYALQFPNAQNGILTGNLPTLTRVAGSVRFNHPVSTTNSLGILFFNGATPAFTLTVVAATGVISIRTGNATGTVIQSGGAVAINTTHVLSWDVTIGASASYNVYLDGVLLFSGSGNTGNAQTSINLIQFSNSLGNSVIIDDLVVYDPANAAYNSTALTQNVVVETQFATSDTQTQFVNDGNVLPPTGIAAYGVYNAVNSTSVTNAPGANQIFLLKVIPRINCTINSVSVVPHVTSGSVKSQAVIYSDSGGSPGTLLSAGTEVIGTVAGTTLTAPLTTPQALTLSTPYWIGFITDTSVALRQVDNTTNLGQKKANTYTSGAPGSLSGMTASQPTWWMWGNCTGAAANWVTVGMNPALGTSAAQTHSSTIGAEDLYGFPALLTNPTTIYGAMVKGFISKSDTGGRTVSLNMKSGATDSTGSTPGQGMATTNQWLRSGFDLDPATGVAWTQAGLNAAKSGVSVAS